MDLEQKVAHLRQRIQELRNQLEPTTNLNATTSIEQPKQSAADEYKARLMNKKKS